MFDVSFSVSTLFKMVEDIDVDLLISLVEERPALWDKTDDDYKDKFLKTSAWKEVCQILFPEFEDKTSKEKTKLGNELVKKWTNIKDYFTKYVKRLESANKSGAGAKKIKPYHFYKQLLFLKKNAANLTDSSILDVEDQESDVENQNVETRSRYQPTSRKRKLKDEFESEILQALKVTENRHQSFFNGILPSLNKLDDHQTLIFQSRVLNILTEFYQPPYRSSQTGCRNCQTSYDRNDQRPQSSSYYSNYQSDRNNTSTTDVTQTPVPSFGETSNDNATANTTADDLYNFS